MMKTKSRKCDFKKSTMLFKGTMFDTLKYTIITVALFGLSALAVILEKDVPAPPPAWCA